MISVLSISLVCLASLATAADKCTWGWVDKTTITSTIANAEPIVGVSGDKVAVALKDTLFVRHTDGKFKSKKASGGDISRVVVASDKYYVLVGGKTQFTEFKDADLKDFEDAPHTRTSAVTDFAFDGTELCQIDSNKKIWRNSVEVTVTGGAPTELNRMTTTGATILATGKKASTNAGFHAIANTATAVNTNIGHNGALAVKGTDIFIVGGANGMTKTGALFTSGSKLSDSTIKDVMFVNVVNSGGSIVAHSAPASADNKLFYSPDGEKFTEVAMPTKFTDKKKKMGVAADSTKAKLFGVYQTKDKSYTLAERYCVPDKPSGAATKSALAGLAVLVVGTFLL